MLRRGKKGDTEKWNAKKQSGWIYDGTWWRHYRNGKPTGKKEKHRMSTNVFKGLGTGQVLRFFTATPSQEHLQLKRDFKAKRKAERKEKLKLKKQKEKEDINKILERDKDLNTSTKKKSGWWLYDKYGERLQNISEKAKKQKKNKEILNRAKENLNKTDGGSTKTQNGNVSPKKRIRRTGREALRAKNVERFGEAHVAHLQAKHADFKKMKRKEMSKEAFIKKYPKSQTAKRSKKSRR